MDLAGNDIGNAGARSIAPVLSQSRSLWILDVSRNSIGVEGAQVFADALPQWSLNFMFHLEKNDIGIAGLQRLVSVLSQCTFHSCLVFDFDQFNDEELETLADVLGKYQDFQYQDSNGYSICFEESQGLASVLAQCKVILNLHNLPAVNGLGAAERIHFKASVGQQSFIYHTIIRKR